MASAACRLQPAYCRQCARSSPRGPWLPLRGYFELCSLYILQKLHCHNKYLMANAILVSDLSWEIVKEKSEQAEAWKKSSEE